MKTIKYIIGIAAVISFMSFFAACSSDEPSIPNGIDNPASYVNGNYETNNLRFSVINGQATVLGFITDNVKADIPSHIAILKDKEWKNCKVVAIAPNAFKQSIIEEVIIPSTITSIGISAFENSHLKILNISNGIIYERAFMGCPLLEKVSLGNGVTKLGKEAFANCSSLNSTSFGNAITSIGEKCFINTALENVTIPSGNIEKRAFYNTPILEVSLGNNVERIEEAAFNQGRANPMYSLTIGTNVKYIAHDAFRSSAKITYNAIDCKIGNAPYYGHLSCRQELILGNEVVNIPNNCFSGGGFTKLVIPNSVITIGDEAFMMGAIKEIDFGNSVRKIGKSAFSYMWDYAIGRRPLKEVYLPNSIEIIDDEAFREAGLEKVVIGTGIKSIGDYAFYLNDNMEVFIFKSLTPPVLGTSAINFVTTCDHIYVPDESFEAYANALGYGEPFLKRLSTYNGSY